MTQDILPSSMEIGRWHRILHVCEASTSKPPQCPSPTWCPFSWVRRLLVSTILLIFSRKIFGSFISKMDSYHGFVSCLCSISLSLVLLAQSCSFIMHPLYNLSKASLWLFCLMLNNPRLPLPSDRMTKYKPLSKPRVIDDLPPSLSKPSLTSHLATHSVQHWLNYALSFSIAGLLTFKFFLEILHSYVAHPLLFLKTTFNVLLKF